MREYFECSRGWLIRSTSTTGAPVERTSAFVNFCLPITCSTGSKAARRYALKAQP